ncbi:MAG TPA: hypothetical protein VLF18_22365 [Tahibacter sp.]|uniref:hypothetical protein n=1 Tax=Tahibacter sp. TaxID=2056211 RepID=UPI002CCE35D1|nr:hypothetical protein [Tahibacter sp.]HSX62939.1 hypothetical protein [Tahibacter sp.]
MKNVATKKAAAKKRAAAKAATKKSVAKKAPAKAATGTAARRTPAKKKTKRSAAGATAPVWIRHYCQGLGDCHLLRFAKDDGRFWHLLIDCGIHGSVKGGSDIMDRVVADIATVAPVIDVLAITHEHIDHVSAFLSAAEHFANIEVREVWMAWTENPRDAQAREFDTFKVDALTALQRASLRLHGLGAVDPTMSRVRDGVQAVLGFQFGAKGERVRAARDAGAALAKGNVRYLEPKQPPIAPDGVPNVRIYTLGPSRDTAFFGIRERASEMYSAAAERDAAAVNRLDRALGKDAACQMQDEHAPFDPNLGLALDDALGSNEIAEDDQANVRRIVRDVYAAGDGQWRRIDGDWLGLSADLAMQLDDRTNNSSLVLAFEFVDTGRVLLFAADAQVGNWLSWQDTRWNIDGADVTGPDLLSRVVYYKVGHHGSQNATLKSKGLQLMNDPDLSAFIPTNEMDAKKVKWEAMPFRGIMEDLTLRAQDRVIRADDAWLASGEADPRFRKRSGSLVSVKPGGDGLWVDVEVL